MHKGAMPLDLPLEISSEPAPELLTALAGLPLVSGTFRELKLAESIGRHIALKKRERGLKEAQMVESFVLLNAAGGECLDDFKRLSADEGLAAMLGHTIASPEAARKFLYGFPIASRRWRPRKQRASPSRSRSSRRRRGPWRAWRR